MDKAKWSTNSGDKASWSAYYREIAKEEYNPDYYDDGAVATMHLGGALLILQMQRNGEWSVIGLEETNNGYSRKRNGEETSYEDGKLRVSGERKNDGHMGTQGRTGSDRANRSPAGQRSDSEGNGEIRAADYEKNGGENASDKVTGKFSQDLEELDALRKENERLKNRVEHWKGQLRQTTPETRSVRQGDIDRLARQLVKDFGGTLKASDISGRLKALGDLIVRGGDG